MDSFAAFLSDMGAAPSPDHQIDRLRNEDDYGTDNCQWATPQEQQANTSKVVLLTFRGITLSVLDWSTLLDVPLDTLKSRLNKLNWSIEESLMVPVFEHMKAGYKRPTLPKGTNQERQSRANDQ